MIVSNAFSRAAGSAGSVSPWIRNFRRGALCFGEPSLRILIPGLGFDERAEELGGFGGVMRAFEQSRCRIEAGERLARYQDHAPKKSHRARKIVVFDFHFGEAEERGLVETASFHLIGVDEFQHATRRDGVAFLQ